MPKTASWHDDEQHYSCPHCKICADCGDEECPHVDCDDECGALLKPETLEEFQAALEHWMNHGAQYGCSHGR